MDCLRVIALIVCLGCYEQAMAVEKVFERGYTLTVSWEIPTERENGQPLKLIEISHFNVRWSCDTGVSGIMKVLSPLRETLVSTANIWGKCNFFVTSVDTDGISAEWSDPKLVLIKLPKPKTGGFR